MTTSAILASLLEAFLAEPGADALAVLADCCEEHGRREDAAWLRGGFKVGLDLDGEWSVRVPKVVIPSYFKDEEAAWRHVANVARSRLTEPCRGPVSHRVGGHFWSVATDCECRGRGWVLKG